MLKTFEVFPEEIQRIRRLNAKVNQINVKNQVQRSILDYYNV